MITLCQHICIGGPFAFGAACTGCLGFVVTAFALYRHALDSEDLYLTIGGKLAFGSSTAVAANFFGLSTTFHTFKKSLVQSSPLLGKDGYSRHLRTCPRHRIINDFLRVLLQTSHPKAILGTEFLLGSSCHSRTVRHTGGGGSKMRRLRGGVFTFLALSVLLPFFHSAGLIG